MSQATHSTSAGRALYVAITLVVLAIGTGWFALKRSADDERRPRPALSPSAQIRPRDPAPNPAATLAPAQAPDAGAARTSETPVAPVAPRTGTPRVFGHVSGPARVPIEGAIVEISLQARGDVTWIGSATTTKQGEYEVLTNAFFELDEPTRATAGVLGYAQAPHYRPVHASAPLDVRERAHELRLDFRLESGGALKGRVVDERSKPVLDATVVLSVESRSRDTVRFQPVGETRSGPEGRFQLGFTSSALHHLAVRRDGIGTALLEELELEAGVERVIHDVVLHGGAPITGTLTRFDHEPAAHFELWATDESLAEEANGLSIASRQAADVERDDGLSCSRTTTGADGLFAFKGLRPGRYAIRSADPRVTVEPRATRVEPGASGVELTIDAHRLVVRVVDDAGAPLPRAGVSLTELEARDDGSLEPKAVHNAITAGRDAITSFTVEPRRSYALQALTRAGRGPEQLVLFAAGEFEREITLVLPRASAQGRLRLNVTGADGKPFGALRVVLLSTITRNRLVDVGELEPDALGLLPPIHAGAYFVLVGFAPGTERDHLPVQSDAPIEVVAGEMKDVTLVARLGARVELELRLRDQIPFGFDEPGPSDAQVALRARFTDLRRKRFGVAVSLRPSSGGSSRRVRLRVGDRVENTLIPGEIGLSEELLEPGEYVVEIESPHFRARPSRARATVGARARVVVDLEAQ